MDDVRHVAGQIVVPQSWVCAFCHGVKMDGMTAVIHATRFKPGATTGYQVAYWFCDDGCRQMWLDRAEPADRQVGSNLKRKPGSVGSSPQDPTNIAPSHDLHSNDVGHSEAT